MEVYKHSEILPPNLMGTLVIRPGVPEARALVGWEGQAAVGKEHWSCLGRHQWASGRLGIPDQGSRQVLEQPGSQGPAQNVPWGRWFGEGGTRAKLTTWLDHKGLEEVEGQWPRERASWHLK